MSVLAEHPELDASGPAAPPATHTRRALIWGSVGSAFLVGSGLARLVQERRFAQEKGYLEACPFPLKSIPTQLGTWKMLENGEVTLDPLTLRISGASDYIVRGYVDELTGVVLNVLVLFGPAEPVVPHTPDICYPSSGFVRTDEPENRAITDASGKVYNFRSNIFAKSGGRGIIREAAYHSFRLNEEWSPDTPNRWPRKNPGVMKVQVQRRIGSGEKRERNDPVEQFLAQLMPVIEKKIREKTPSDDSAKGATVG